MRIQRLMTVAAMLAVGLGTLDAQEPAWRRVAKKLRPNSMDKNPAVAGRGTAEVPYEDAAKSTVANIPGGVESVRGSMIPDAGTIGLPMARQGRESSINLGLESEEAGSFTNLFEDPMVLRMLGTAPRFIYQSHNRPDPMVFPPVRNAAIYAELVLKAETKVAEDELEQAIALYRIILDLKDRRYLVEMRTKIGELQSKLGAIADAATAGGDGELIRELPIWVRDNTRGVLAGSTKPMCLVGDFLLALGEPVPAYPSVEVAAIDSQMVTFRIADQEFEVQVKGYDE